MYSWFQAFAVFCMLYAFFWVITQKKAYNNEFRLILISVMEVNGPIACNYSVPEVAQEGKWSSL